MKSIMEEVRKLDLMQISDNIEKCKTCGEDIPVWIHVCLECLIKNK